MHIMQIKDAIQAIRTCILFFDQSCMALRLAAPAQLPSYGRRAFWRSHFEVQNQKRADRVLVKRRSVWIGSRNERGGAGAGPEQIRAGRREQVGQDENTGNGGQAVAEQCPGKRLRYLSSRVSSA